MQVVLKLEELSKVQEKLKDLEINLSNKKLLLGEIGNYLNNNAKDSFEKEQDWNGNPWSPLSSATYLFKQKKGKPDKKLFYDGDLQDKLITQTTSSTVSIGTNAATQSGFLYPGVMQFGSKNAGRNRKTTIKARPFLPINLDGSLYQGVENEIVEIVVDFIESAIEKVDLK